jgi:hypothetical protein
MVHFGVDWFPQSSYYNGEKAEEGSHFTRTSWSDATKEGGKKKKKEKQESKKEERQQRYYENHRVKMRLKRFIYCKGAVTPHPLIIVHGEQFNEMKKNSIVLKNMEGLMWTRRTVQMEEWRIIQ